MTRVRTASKIHCSIRMRREFLRIAASRNCIAAHCISRNLPPVQQVNDDRDRSRAQPPEERTLREAEGP